MNDYNQATKLLISEKLLELSRQKDPGSITVKELVNACNISRQLFYYYFQDILDVIQWTCEVKLLELSEKCSKITDVNESVHTFMNAIMEYKPIMKRALSSKMSDQIILTLISSVKRLTSVTAERKGKITGWSEDRKEFFTDLIAYGISGYFLDSCFETEHTGFSDQFADMMERFLDNIQNIY